ncbi:MAG: hypothetical protein ACI8Y7_000847 [Candidatus Woesearchaeota archaeon]|jgi:uncharacterized protein (TIGR00251 family)
MFTPTQDHFYVQIKPNKSLSKITAYDEKTNMYTIELKAVAQDGKANLELCKFLKKLLKKEITIISGKTSRNKLIHAR